MATGRVPTTANSPLTTKGDLFGYSTAPARLAVGSDGETIVADSSTATGLRYTPQNALVNPVINGGFDNWQRGTSISVVSSTAAYTADRWSVTTAPNQATTISRQTTSDTTNLPNIQYCARVQRNSGQTGTANHVFSTSFETSNSLPFAGKTVTLSFYARAGANFSATSSILGVYLISGTGTDQNRSVGAYTGEAYPINNVSVTLTTTWQRFTFTGTVASTATELSPYFYYQPTGTAGTNDYYEITGVQIDLGTYTASSAPTFRRTGGTIQGELAACQRYYWRTTGQAANSNDLLPATMFSSTSITGVLRFPVPMRTAATCSFSAAGDFQFVWSAGTSTISGANIDRTSAESLNLRLTSTGLTTNGGGYVAIATGSTKWLEASAEL